MKIAILQADQLYENLQERFDSYAAMFMPLLSAENSSIQFTVFDVYAEQYPSQNQSFQAFIITGSKSDAFADEPWIIKLKAFVQQLIAKEIPVLGVCFGHQLLALCLGAKVARAAQGWGVGVHHYCIAQQASWMQTAPSYVSLAASHQDQVQTVPAQATVFLSSPFCPVAGFYLANKVFSVQGHPEFSAEYAEALLLERKACFDDGLLEHALASLQGKKDDAILANWMLAFIEQATMQREAQSA